MTAGPREGVFNFLTPYFLALALPLALGYSSFMGLCMVSLTSLYPVSVHLVLYPETYSLR